jgi:hypothetical protein
VTGQFDAMRWLKPESVVLLLFLALVAWISFPYGSNRAWAELPAVLGLSGVLLCWAGLVMSGVASQTPLIRQLRWPALCTAIALGWGTIQSLDLGLLHSLSGIDLEWLAHPVWSAAASTLELNTGAYISIDPAATRQALLAALLPVMAFLLAFNLGRDRDRATVILMSVVFVGIACAIMASANYLFAIDLQSISLPEARPTGQGFAAPFMNPDHLGALLGLAAIAALGTFAERFRQAVPWGKDTRTTLAGIGRSLEGVDGALLILGACLLSALVATASGVAIAGVLAGLVMLMLQLAHVPDEDEPQAHGRRAVTAILVAVLGILVATGARSMLERFGPPALDPSIRQAIAAATLDAIGSAPWLGQGFGAFEGYHTINGGLGVPGTVQEANNDLLEPMADLGIPAGLAFLASPLLICLQCLSGAAIRRRDRAFPAVAVASCMCMAVHAVAGFSLQIPAVSVIFAVLLGIGAVQSWRTNMDLVR